MRKVYQFGLLPPTEGEHLVRAELRAAHEYRNSLVAIERGRRSAIRAVHETEEVAEAADAVKAATKSTRKGAVSALYGARRQAQRDQAERLGEVKELEHDILKAAYNNAGVAWGTKLDVAAAHQQSRRANFYGKDALTPNDPSFNHGPRWRDALGEDDPRSVWWLKNGQLAVQLQGGAFTDEIVSGTDTRVRLVLGDPRNTNTRARRARRRFGTLFLRVGSDGRDPIWAAWPIIYDRAVPHTASWKWVRVSCRRNGMREAWTVEITVDDDAPRPRDLDRSIEGSVAVEWEWSPVKDAKDVKNDAIRVARWADDRGDRGEIVLPGSIARGIRKPDGIRAVRDRLLNEMQPKLAGALRDGALQEATQRKHSDRTSLQEGARRVLPEWLQEAASTLHLWRSHDRFRALEMRWRRVAPSVLPAALAILSAWYKRDAHLYAYETGARKEALLERREFYRLVASRWATLGTSRPTPGAPWSAPVYRGYKRVLLSDQDLSYQARRGDASDVRTTASVHELRMALRNAFGEEDAIDAKWRLPAGEDARTWCERVRDAWQAGGARGDGIFAARKEKTTNAWAARKAKAARLRAEKEGAAHEENAKSAT
jgi:hypothetical protein